MADPLASGLGGGNMGADLGGGMGGGFGGGLGDSKLKRYLKYTLIGAAIVGILAALGIFIQILSLDMGYKIQISVENLGILAGVCAFITGLNVLVSMIKNRGRI
jgi:hypothetical protein